MTTWVAGVDGCRAGWAVVLLALHENESQTPQIHLCAHFGDVLMLQPTPSVIAIDIPIGLLDAPQPGGRRCDRQARRLLGRRASCVFSPPSRICLEATVYDQVRTYGVSRQAFGILPKIREVDRLMTPAQQHTVYEAHPELAFRALTGAPIPDNKKTRLGYETRLQALARMPDSPFRRLQPVLATALRTYKRTQVTPDDLLDAAVLAWTAGRITTGHATCLPPQPPVDARGLRMEVWY